MGRKKKFKKKKSSWQPCPISNNRKHDGIIHRLENKLHDKMDLNVKNLEYGVKPNGCVVGEIDYLAYRDRTDTLYLFEIKSNDGYKLRSKAKRQMERATQKFAHNDFARKYGRYPKRVITYHVYGLGKTNYGVDLLKINHF